VILARDKVYVGNWIYWTVTLVITNNYDNLTELHTSKVITITREQFSVAVPWWWLSTVNDHVPVSVGAVPVLGYQLLTSHNC
jgi:hypothetical protein